MEEKYLLYNQQINTEYEAGILVIVLFVCFLIAVTIYVLYTKMPGFLIGVGILAMILLLYFLFEVYPLRKDADECAYATYDGEFFVESYFGMNNGKAFILIQTPEDNKSIRYQVLCDKLDVAENQTYRGCFVYGQNSRCIVDFSVNTGSRNTEDGLRRTGDGPVSSCLAPSSIP